MVSKPIEHRGFYFKFLSLGRESRRELYWFLAASRPLGVKSAPDGLHCNATWTQIQIQQKSKSPRGKFSWGWNAMQLDGICIAPPRALFFIGQYVQTESTFWPINSFLGQSVRAQQEAFFWLDFPLKNCKVFSPDHLFSLGYISLQCKLWRNLSYHPLLFSIHSKSVKGLRIQPRKAR